MQKTIGMLAVLLIAQLVLAVGMSFTGPKLTVQRLNTPLLDLGDQTVDRLVITGSENQEVVLSRQGDAWRLPDTGDFPADNARVDSLLERLKGLKRGMTVATTEGALKRFKVSEEAFERRLTLAQGDETLATLYFGTSPAMRQVHARSREDDAVFTTELGIHDVPAKPEDWEDKQVLTIPQAEIEAIALADLTLTRTSSAPAGGTSEEDQDKATGSTTWNAEALQEGETVNQTNADALARNLATLTIGSVLGREAKPEFGLATPALELKVTRQGGETLDYRLGKREKENNYVLKVSSRPEYFRLPSYTADALIEAAGRDQIAIVAAGALETGSVADQPEQPAPTEAAKPAVEQKGEADAPKR